MPERPQSPHPESRHEGGALVLDDGSRLRVWRALPEDRRRVQAFLDELSEEEVRETAASLRLEPDELARALTRPRPGDTLLVEAEERAERLAGLAAWRSSDDADGAAVVGVAVAPSFRRHHLGRRLLERIGVWAAHAGAEVLEGRASAENEALERLFEGSGLQVRESEEDGERHLTVELRSAVEGKELEDFARRIVAASSLRPLFRPDTVAVVGASRDPGKVGHRIFRSLLDADFRGTVHPVNPEADQVESVRAYPSVAEVPDEVELAVVAVPAPAVAEVVEACGEAGVEALVVISAGFAETGDEGRRMQDEVLERVRAHGMRMVGPNCLGLISTDPDVRLNASFAPSMPPPGRAALCSQSGALGIAVIASARRVSLGLSTFVSVGNKADVTADHLLEYWQEDPSTDVALFYLESFSEPRRLGRIAREVARSKPVVMVKSGRTEAGGRAAGSHTAALAGSDVAVEAFFAQTGIIRAGSLQEMFDLARFLTLEPLPPGRKVAVVTNAGGPSILCADALESAGLDVPTLDRETRDRLGEVLPDAAATANPVDMVASAGPEEYSETIQAVLASPEVDALVVIYTPVGLFETGEVEEAVLDAVEEARANGADGKPVVASVVGGEEEVYALSAGERSLPAYPFPEEIGRTLGRVIGYREWRDEAPGSFPDFPDQELKEARDVCRAALDERGEGWLPVERALEVLEAAGLQVAEGGVAADADEAVEIAEEVGWPVVAKVASTEVVHKTEMGGVELGLEDADALRDAVDVIEERMEEAGELESMEGILVQPMLEGAAEVMLGVSPDPVFGPVLSFGLGGIHVEVLEDVAFRVAPLTDRDAAEAVREIRGFELLTGYRDHPEADLDALEEALLRLSRLVEEVPEIGEMDLNPVFALEPGSGYRVVDASVEVRQPGGG